MRKAIAHLEQKQLKTLSTYFRMLSAGYHFCLTARGAFRRWSTACQLKTAAMWNRRLAMARGLASLRAEAIRIAGVVRQERPELSAFSRLIRMRDEARSDRLRLREATGLLARRVRDFRKGLIVFRGRWSGGLGGPAMSWVRPDKIPNPFVRAKRRSCRGRHCDPSLREDDGDASQLLDP